MATMYRVEESIMEQDSVAKRLADFEAFELLCKKKPVLIRPITTLEIVQAIYIRETEQRDPTSQYCQQNIMISSVLIASYIDCFKQGMMHAAAAGTADAFMKTVLVGAARQEALQILIRLHPEYDGTP